MTRRPVHREDDAVDDVAVLAEAGGVEDLTGERDAVVGDAGDAGVVVRVGGGDAREGGAVAVGVVYGSLFGKAEKPHLAGEVGVVAFTPVSRTAIFA